MHTIVGCSRDDDFVKLWSGQTISRLGSTITAVALELTALLVLRATPLQLGMRVSVSTVPALLGAVFVGTLVDRMSRRQLLIAADFLRAVVLAVVPWLVWTGQLRFLHLVVVSAVVGALTLLFEVAFLSFVPSLFEDYLLEANAMLALSDSTAEILGAGQCRNVLTAGRHRTGRRSTGRIPRRSDRHSGNSRPGGGGNVCRQSLGGTFAGPRAPALFRGYWARGSTGVRPIQTCRRALTDIPPARILLNMQPNLFADETPENRNSTTPLAARMRPGSLDDYVGQEHLVGPGRILRRAIETDRINSMILWGPPGTGKTTLAQIIANATQAHFVGLSAVSAGVADLRKAIDDAARRRQQLDQRTILLIDEIHRFNKAQQDSILHAVEQGVITLIGATTENPSFEVNSALLSRCRVFTLRPLRDDQIASILRRAVEDSDRGLGSLQVQLLDDARDALIALADGDARTALNGLELASLAVPVDLAGRRIVTRDGVEEAMQRRALRYDRAGDQHYEVISAFIKSVRGSDPDAAIYWLARMLEAGEDPLFIVRRLVILAAEDIGLADPQALVIASAAQQGVHFVGMPEGYLILAEATLYLAVAPKSNSALAAYGRARDAIEKRGTLPVPLHLRNAPTGLMRSLGFGKDYAYSHEFAVDDPRRYRQQYLPDGIERGFYQPTAYGYEARVQERMKRIEEIRRSTTEAPRQDSGRPEVAKGHEPSS